MYLKYKDSTITYPYSPNQLAIDNPNVSFPTFIGDEMLIEWDVCKVQPVDAPNDYTKNISEGTPIQTDGIWYQNWVSVDASNVEISQRLQIQWNIVREQRDLLLSECDWTQLADSPQKDNNDWKNYRQSLRDITNQSNPFNINWPVKP